jgi:hypothetical protein
MMFAPIIAKNVFLLGDFFGFFLYFFDTASSAAPQIPPWQGMQGLNPGLLRFATCDFGIGSQKL